MSLVLLLPAYNEGENLPALLESVRSASRELNAALRTVLIDDGSTDSTRDIALSPDIEVIRHPRNRGFPEALRSGLRRALELQREGFQAVVVMDADNTQPPALMAEMLRVLESGKDVVIGSRFCPGGRQTGVPPHRRFLGNACEKILKSLFHFEGVSDYTSSYRMIRLETLQKASEQTRGRFFESESFVCAFEFLLNLRKAGARLAEVPLELHYERKRGPSKMRLLRTIAGYARLLGREKLG